MEIHSLGQKMKNVRFMDGGCSSLTTKRDQVGPKLVPSPPPPQVARGGNSSPLVWIWKKGVTYLSSFVGYRGFYRQNEKGLGVAGYVAL